MMFQSSSRQDGHSLLTSFVYTRAIRRLKKQVAALTREKEELQQLIEESKKREQHKDQRLDKLQQLMEALQRQLDESKAQMLQAAKESKERDYQMLEAQQQLIESIQRYTKSGVYALIGTELIGDLIIDLYKEVVKRAIGQDTWEAWGNLIRSWIGPWLSAILEAIASNFPMLLLIIKAAITIMVIAAPILNLTVLVWPTLRAGLGKLRSKRASKK